EFLVYNGPDEQFLGGRIMGADGGIGGTYGVMPQLFAKLDELFVRGEIQKAQQLQTKVNNYITRLLSYPSLFGAAKAILAMRGIETGRPRSPLLPVGPEHMDSLKKLNQDIEETIAAAAHM